MFSEIQGLFQLPTICLMISGKYHEEHASSPWLTQAPNVSTRHTKNCVSEFPFLSALKLPLGRIVVFIDMTRTRIY